MKSGSAAAAVEQTKPSIKISAHHKGAGFAAERVYTNHNNVLDNVDARKKKPSRLRLQSCVFSFNYHHYLLLVS